ncbi:FG-GAP-like repeat-containing protein [Streptomyces sp. NPDC020898]|uniref:FG-GAP-like repeat-containing protein n=1 Tax=Streptomyces sp. NPDC020898 TaxID=3365101 RepID=UPI0037B1F7A5
MSDHESAAAASGEAATSEPTPPGRPGVRRGIAAAIALALLAGGATVLALGDDGPAAKSSPGAGAKAKPATSETGAEDAAQRKARKTGKKVEVAALTDEFSQTFANPNGSFTYTASVAPVRAKNAQGKWAPVDTSLREGKAGWSTVNSPYPVTFAAGDADHSPAEGKSKAHGASYSGKSAVGHGTPAISTAAYRTPGKGASGAVQAADDADNSWTPLLTMGVEGHEINVEWPGALPEPVVEDNRALYEGVLPDVDLMLTARDTGYTHVLVIHTPEAAAALAAEPPRYRFTSPTLGFSLDPSTDVMRGRDKDGNEISVSPTPFLWDSAGTHDTDAPATDPDSAAGSNEDAEDVEGWTSDVDKSVEVDPEDSAGDADAAFTGSDIDPAAYALPAAAASETLALPAVNGPGEGAHAATAGAALNQVSRVLTIDPPSDYLDRTGANAPVYPLFLDPSTSATRSHWTSVYKKYPGSNFYDGANYNQDTKEARVGFERDTWGTSRSFFKLILQKSIKGADVSKATLKILETHSWSCSKRTVQVWRTDPFSSATTWNKQPSWKRKITSKSFAYGWKSNSSCPDTNVNFTVTSLAQEAADNGWMSFNIGLVASTSSSAPTTSSSSLETDTYSWKKFKAEGAGSPTVSIEYNRKPGTPSSVTMSPGSCDTSASPYINVGKTAPTLKAKATDLDSDLSRMEFQIGLAGSSTHTSVYDTGVDDGETAEVKLNQSTTYTLAHGKTYEWRVRAWDPKVSGPYAPTSGTDWCRFTYDTDLPDSPALVTSTEFPADSDNDSNGEVWSKVKFGTAGNFTFTKGADTDIVKFVFSINNTSYDHYACAGTKQGTGSATCTTVISSTEDYTGMQPPSAGPNTLYVKAVDSAGNISPNPYKHTFYVTPRPTADAAGDLNGDGSADYGAVTAAGNLWINTTDHYADWIASSWGQHNNGTLLHESTTAPHIWNGDSTAPVYSLVTHNGDFAPGDGVTDWVIRTPDNRLFIYPGDGYGAINVADRVEVRLPANVPAPSTWSEIKSAGDLTGDGQPELFIAGGVNGAELWVLSGYTGGTFTTATQMTASAWDTRDFVAIGDYNGDKAMDLTYRTAAGNIQLRKGILGSDGVSTVLTSLGTSAASLDGDDAYASGTMLPADYPLVYGSPDISGDDIPDLLATEKATGALLMFSGSATTMNATPKTLKSSGYETVQRVG